MVSAGGSSCPSCYCCSWLSLGWGRLWLGAAPRRRTPRFFSYCSLSRTEGAAGRAYDGRVADRESRALGDGAPVTTERAEPRGVPVAPCPPYPLGQGRRSWGLPGALLSARPRTQPAAPPLGLSLHKHVGPRTLLGDAVGRCRHLTPVVSRVLLPCGRDPKL